MTISDPLFASKICKRTCSLFPVPLAAIALVLTFLLPAAAPGQEVWDSFSIGNPQHPHHSTYQEVNDEFHLQVSGSAFWATSDSGGLTALEIEGDFDLSARLSSFQAVNQWAKCGLMARASADPSSPYLAVFLSNQAKVSTQFRQHSGSSTVNQGGAQNIHAPVWLRLKREGNTLSTFYSMDDNSWNLLRSQEFSLPNQLWIGLALSSNQNSSPATAIFDSVTVEGQQSDSQTPQDLTASLLAARVDQKPTINGTVEGSLQQNQAQNTTFNSNARILGSFLIPGTPDIRINGTPNLGGVENGTGSLEPSNHRITLNSGATIETIIESKTAPAPWNPPTTASP